MKQFKNIFDNLCMNSNINFNSLVYTRRAKLIKEGYNTDNINWDLYSKVLEAKFNKLNNE